MLQFNTIYCGDNLPVLQGFEDESVDLVYIDPPFFTSKQYEVIWKDGAEVRQFEDRWVKMGETGRYSKDINTYLEFMEPRLREIYRVLKKTGSFYLHCDWHADAYLRILCDQIFKRDPETVITWKRHNANQSPATYGKIIDTILFYTKNDNFPFTKQYVGETNVGDFPCVEKETNRRYKTHTMIKAGNTNQSLSINSKIYTTSKRFVWSQITLDERLSANPYIIEINSKGVPVYKMYMDEYKGALLQNIWDDIIEVRQGNGESLGYPTQKPEELLERIIKASSNENDVVLDCFCGCGTTLAVAKRLKRHFVGIDVSPTACRLVAKRIGYSLATIIGLPLTAEEIVGLTGYEFQNAIITLLDPSLETIKVGNKGADGGIDGSYYDLPISVKKYKAGRKDLDEFVATLYRNKKTVGLFAALEFSSDFLKEVARLGREQGITLHHYTFAQVIAGEHKKIMSEENKQHGKLF